MSEKNKSIELTIEDIKKLIPHRYPFLLVDKIIDFEPDISAHAIKCVTINEPFFQGHFPGQPVMPGVLSLEMMAQAGSFLMLSEVEDPLSMNMFFSAVESSRFKKLIVPGDQLKIHMKLVKKKLNLCKFFGRCMVDENLVAESYFSANLVKRARE